MKRAIVISAVAGLAAVLLGAAAARELGAQQAPGVKRNILLTQDMTIPGREAVLARVELDPGAVEVPHTHPAEVYGFVEEGRISLSIEGKPTRTLTAGDVFSVPPGKVHWGKNTGGAAAKLSVVFIAEKGKPLTTPVSPAAPAYR